ncbi:hypothetical protein ACFVSQ_37145 [Streptomyces niveus]|uniref:hypothetical protein n=1 Tax=Streptomyces niveus TaxID=193462 RepID=UPI0036E3CDC3
MSTSSFSTPPPGSPAPEGTNRWPGPEQRAALAAAGEAGLRAAGWLRDLVGRGEPRCLLDLAGDVVQALTGLDPYDHDTPEHEGRGGVVPELRERLVDPWWILDGDLPLTPSLRAALLVLCSAACTAPVVVADGLDAAGLRAVCEVIDHTVGADPGPAEPACYSGPVEAGVGADATPDDVLRAFSELRVQRLARREVRSALTAAVPSSGVDHWQGAG